MLRPASDILGGELTLCPPEDGRGQECFLTNAKARRQKPGLLHLPVTQKTTTEQAYYIAFI